MQQIRKLWKYCQTFGIRGPAANATFKKKFFDVMTSFWTQLLQSQADTFFTFGELIIP